MRIHFETTTDKIVEPGCIVPLEELHQSYGEGSRIEVVPLREGVPIVPTGFETMGWWVKPRNKYTGAAIAACDSFTWSAALKCFVGEVNYNVSTLTTQLAQAQGDQDQQDFLHLWAQFSYKPDSSAGWQRSQVIKTFRLDNALWKGTETVPGVGDPVEPTSGPWLTPLIQSLTEDVVNADPTLNTILDISGLYFPVEAGKRYWFEFEILYDAAATGTGARFSINGPAAPTELNFDSEYSLTPTTTTTNRHLTAYDLPAACNVTSGWTTGNRARIWGWIKPSVSGIVTGRFASEVALSAITVKPGSLVSYVKVS